MTSVEADCKPLVAVDKIGFRKGYERDCLTAANWLHQKMASTSNVVRTNTINETNDKNIFRPEWLLFT
jgi:hypothetical protein